MSRPPHCRLPPPRLGLRAFAAILLVGLSAQIAAADAALETPCALLDDSDHAPLWLSPVGPIESKPYVGRRSSECLWTDTEGQRSLRLVLYPAKDAARPLAQLERMRTSDPQAVSVEVEGRPGVLSGDRSQISLAVGAVMLNLIGSAPLDPAGARAVAAKVIAQIDGAEPQP